MSEFDIFFDEYENKHNCSPEKYECFEAGQKSKQDEIDELQKRIDELSEINESLSDELVAYRSRFGNKGNRHEH